MFRASTMIDAEYYAHLYLALSRFLDFMGIETRIAALEIGLADLK